MTKVEPQRNSYPRIPAKIWWQLRAAAVRSPPKEITSTYLETLLEISAGTAQNVVGNLRAIGLAGSDNKTTQLMHEWRDDETYAKACGEMLKKVYPDEIRQLAPPPSPDRTQVVRWFSRTTKTGETASSQMAAFYLLLAKADPKEAEANDVGEAKKVKAKKEPSGAKRAAREVPAAKATEQVHEVEVHPPKHRTPSMHVDVQIHISPQASMEQIDAIFASMARHLYRD